MIGPISAIMLTLVVGAIITLLTNSTAQARAVAIVSSFIALAISIWMFLTYELNPVTHLAFEEGSANNWISSIGIGYHVGVDGIGLPMVLLATIVCALGTVYSWSESKRPNQFFALVLLMDLTLIGVFVSLDFFMFYVFWELTLLPMFFLIGVWGGPRKDYSAIKFLIYTHIASVIMMLGIFAMYYYNGINTGVYTFDMMTLLHSYPTLPISSFWKNFIFGALMFGFIVKMPSVPFHTWLPDAHVEAPTVGSIILAGVLLKMGGYGLFRVLLPMIPNASPYFIYALALFGLVSIIYSPFAALAQKDIKKLVAFSSIGHMGFISLGVAASVAAGLEGPRILAHTGAMFQMFSHGIITAVLFGSCGVIEHHTHTRIIDDLGGLTKKMPKFAILMVAGFFASLGLPLCSGFVAEFSILGGSFQTLPIFVALAAVTIPFTAGYHLWAVQRTLWGPYNEYLGDIKEIKWYEFATLAIWTILFIVLGIYPQPIFNMMQDTATYFITSGNILPIGGIPI
ncbi:NADH-quinone oxidoreductase subunit M [ANME-2 cluster archaeon]|nr:MAG: NADH-quinone oxidoreductase subunit M [ANME-2 cluster archaeon]